MPTFAQEMRQSKIDAVTAANRSKVAPVLSLLCAREAIDRELSGRKLSALAAAVGDETFDAVCDCQLPDVSLDFAIGNLPQPNSLASEGEALLTQVGTYPPLAALAQLASEIVDGASTSRGAV